MDTITERTESLVGSFAIFDGWGLQFTIFCLALLFVFGTQVLFLFPRQRTWITYAIRVVGSAVPVTVFLFLIAAVYSRSGSISYVTFFQISNIVFAFLGLVAGGVLAYFAGRYFEPFVIEILNKRTRIVDPTYQRTEFVQPFLTRLQSNGFIVRRTRTLLHGFPIKPGRFWFPLREVTL